MNFGELNSYEIGGLSFTILRYVHLDSICYIFGTTAKGTRFVKTLHVHYIIQILFSSIFMRMYVPGSCRINLMRTARPATPLELRHRYLAPNSISNWANARARHNVHQAAQLKAKVIPMHSAKTSGSWNPQGSPLLLPGWSISSSDVSDNCNSHHSRIVSVTSPVEEGSDSTGGWIPLSIKLQRMLNTHHIIKQL